MTQRKIALMYLKFLYLAVLVGAFVLFCLAPWQFEVVVFLLGTFAWACVAAGENK